MRKNLAWIVLTMLLVSAIGIAQTAIRSPALPTNTYLGGADDTGRNRPIVGVNGTDVTIDPDGIGTIFGSTTASAPLTVYGTSMFFSGVTPRFQGPIVDVIFCGDLPNAGINYSSPATGYAGAPAYDLTASSFALAGAGCAAEDNTTEATADEIMYVNNAFEVLSLYCATTASTGGVFFSLRDDTADTAVTLSIAAGNTTGATNTISTTDVAANSAVAMRAITVVDLSGQDFWCLAKIMIIP